MTKPVVLAQFETIDRLIREIDRAESHLRRIYRSSHLVGVVENECSAGLGALAVLRQDLELPSHPMAPT